MHTELICIGTELLMGHLNTNSAFIGEKLADIGIKLNLETTISDEKKDIEKVFREAIKRSNLIITTGGLGPTFDDLTRPILAKVLGRKLVFNREIMESIAFHFAQRDLEMPKVNEKQAYVIENTKVISNKFGTAPGMIIELASPRLRPQGETSPLASRETSRRSPGSDEKLNSKHKLPVTIVVLPGPPAEMQTMMKDSVLPFLKDKFERRIVKSHILHICGLTESDINGKIENIVKTEKRLEGGELKFSLIAHPSIVDIKIVGMGTNAMVIDGLIHKAAEEVKDCLKDNIFGENEETLEGVVGYLLGKRRSTVAIAESCTGGLLGNIITNSPGSSLYFRGGIIAYSNEIKKSILKVSEELLSNYGAVSREIALAMAKGVKELYQTDFALSITGIAGPGGATSEKPVGLVYIALVSEYEEIVKEYKFIGHRKETKFASVMASLDLLRRVLIKNS